jgi:hypothetical protein
MSKRILLPICRRLLKIGSLPPGSHRRKWRPECQNGLSSLKRKPVVSELSGTAGIFLTTGRASCGLH